MSALLTAAQIAAMLGAKATLGSTVNISAASNDANPIAVTATAHGLQTGDIALLLNVGGNTAANGIRNVTRVDANTFSLDGVVGNGNYTSGGTVQKVTPTAGFARNLTPENLKELQYALSRIKFTSDGTALGTIFPAGGPNP